MSYLDNSGLLRKYGTEKTVPTKAGEYKTFGPLREVELKLTDMTTLGASPSIVSDQLFFPAGVRIEEVEVVCDTACTGTGAVLNVGLIKAADRSTEIDYEAFVKALPLTSIDAAGEKTVLRVGSSYAGDLIGTDTAYVGYLTADYTTAAYTAGAITIRIRYYNA